MFLAGKLRHKPGAKKIKKATGDFMYLFRRAERKSEIGFEIQPSRDMAKHLKLGGGHVGGFYLKFEFQC
jgi:hypothetical protein